MSPRRKRSLGLQLGAVLLASCAGPSPRPVAPPEPVAAPVAELRPSLAGAQVVREAAGERWVVGGGVRAILAGDESVRVADDAFAGGIEDVAFESGVLVFRDSLGTLAWSRGFLGRLKRRAREGGPWLWFRGHDGGSFVSNGGPPEPFPVPERTTRVVLASRQAALAWAEGGFLHRTVDGGSSWELMPMADAGPPFRHALSEARFRARGRVHRFTSSGALVEVADEDGAIRALEPEEHAAFVRALQRVFSAVAPAVGGSELDAEIRPRHPVAIEHGGTCPHLDEPAPPLRVEHDLTVERVDVATGTRAPLCPSIPTELHIMAAHARADGGFFLRVIEDAGATFVALGRGSECSPPAALPSRAHGACFIDARRGVAWGSASASQLWHTRDGARSWQPLTLSVDGSPDSIRGAPPERFALDLTRCVIDERVVVDWSKSSAATRVLVSEAGRPSPASEPCRPPPATLFCRSGPERAHEARDVRERFVPAGCDGGRCAARFRGARIELGSAECHRRGFGPWLRLEHEGEGGALLACESGSPLECPCPEPSYWVPERGNIIALQAELLGLEQLVRLPDGGFAVFVVESERALHLGPDGQVVSARRFTTASNLVHGIIVEGGRPLFAIASPDGRALDLYDLASHGAALERRPAVLSAPRRVCGEEDREHPLLYTRGVLADIVWPPGEATGVSTAFAMRASANESCLEQIQVDFDDGRALLVPEGPRAMTGTRRSTRADAPLTCTFFVPGALRLP